MSQVKSFLKNARAALAEADWEYAIESSKDVLKIDKENYFAYVFLGKANEGLENFKKSKESYLKAISLDSTNPVAWKGLFVLFKTVKNLKDIVEWKEYFKYCNDYAQALAQQQQSLIDLINDIRNVRRKYPDAEEPFLESIRPGTEFGELVGREIMTPRDVLRKLLTLKQNSEQQRASKLISAARMKISVNDPDYHFKVNSSAWTVYKDSDVDLLFRQLVNITEDDEKRRNLELQWLEYRIKLLKTMPKEMKPSFYPVVKEMIDDMIVIKHDSLLPWTLYFDWQDYLNVESLDVTVCSEFIKKFPSEPLAMVIYAWISSSLSSYDSKKLSTDVLNSSSPASDPTVNEEDVETESEGISPIVDIEEEASSGLSEATVLEMLQDNIVKCKQSILANRIIAHYYVTQKEFQLALPYIRAGTSAVATSIRDLGASLKNSKFDFTLLYATTYTYFEAPKNHNIALSLFDKVLLEDPKNAEAKMGKGLIFIEMKNWEGASQYLADATAEFPQNWEIISAYGWCLLHVGETQKAIEKFNAVLENTPSSDPKSIDFRALNYWRIAKCYLYEAENNSDKDLINKAYKTLVHALKVSDIYAPAYSLLGYIYQKYYSDESRAFKCFFKALSLDSSDLEAAYYICEKYCAKGNWASAASVAERLIKTEHIKNALQSINWPYRVLGMSHLERQQYAESIEYFQSAIRISASDVESWVGLGQAYLNCGRVEASIKVFQKVIKMKADHKFAQYLLADALASLGEYEKSLELFEKLVMEGQPEECFLVSEISVLVDYAVELYHQGYLLKAVDTAVKSIKKIEIVLCSVSSELYTVWTSLSKALRIFVTIESQIDKLPVDTLVNIFNQIALIEEDTVFEIDNVSLDTILSDDTADNMSIALKFVILSAKYPILAKNFQDSSRTLKASLLYNLGCAELLCYMTINGQNYCDAAIKAFKDAISYQSNNAEAWIGMGIATMDKNYKVSQHCFIKAIVTSPKEIAGWHCLALLALKNNDTEMTHSILLKAQSIAPQDWYSWLGLALMYEKEGKANDSARMFTHAYVLANGKSKITQLLYAKNVLSRRLGKGDNEKDILAQQELSSVAAGLSQYLKKSQNDIFAMQLYILTLERLHEYTTASGLAQYLSTLVEERFEKSQDERELLNFALIKTQLARLYMGNEDYDNAIEAATFALGILEDDENQTDIVKTAIVSNHVTIGLSSFFISDIDQSLDHSNTLISLSPASSSVAILIFKILYAMQSEEASDIALQELMNYIDKNGNDYNVTLTLTAFFILKDRPDELRELAKQLKMLPNSLLLKDQHKDIPFLIQEINKRIGEERDTVDIWQKASFMFPNNPNVWDRLSTEISCRISASGQNRVSPLHLSNKLAKRGTLTKAQKAMYLCPWNAQAVNALKECFKAI